MQRGTHEAKENVWNVLSQPWLAWPRSVESLVTSLEVDILDRLAVAEADVVEDFLRKALVDAAERRVEREGRRANSLNNCEGLEL